MTGQLNANPPSVLFAEGAARTAEDCGGHGPSVNALYMAVRPQRPGVLPKNQQVRALRRQWDGVYDLPKMQMPQHMGRASLVSQDVRMISQSCVYWVLTTSTRRSSCSCDSVPLGNLG